MRAPGIEDRPRKAGRKCYADAKSQHQILHYETLIYKIRALLLPHCDAHPPTGYAIPGQRPWDAGDARAILPHCSVLSVER